MRGPPGSGRDGAVTDDGGPRPGGAALVPGGRSGAIGPCAGDGAIGPENALSEAIDNM